VPDAKVEEPSLVKRAEPRTPKHLQDVRGTVALEFIVAEDGSVEAPCVLKSLMPVLDLASVQAVRKWRYKPAKLNGKPVKVLVVSTFTFGGKRG
jgi:periplasmic protein TonB